MVLALKALKPRAAAYEVRDLALTGTYVQVWPSGATSYILRYRFRGASKKLVIGRFYPDAGGLAEVRRAAREAQNRVMEARRQNADELDPVAARKAQQAHEPFLASRASRSKCRPLRAPPGGAGGGGLHRSLRQAPHQRLARNRAATEKRDRLDVGRAGGCRKFPVPKSGRRCARSRSAPQSPSTVFTAAFASSAIGRWKKRLFPCRPSRR